MLLLLPYTPPSPPRIDPAAADSLLEQFSTLTPAERAAEVERLVESQDVDRLHRLLSARGGD